MREIKMRAWDIKGNQYWCATEGDWKIELHEGHPPQLFIFDYESEHGSWIEIEDVVFEEYTGLKDKNGVEIYEGDILKCKCAKQTSIGFSAEEEYFYKNSVIEWWQSHSNLGYRLREGKGKTFMAKPSSLSTMEVEVIGNIYENPELLEVAE